MSVQLIVLRPDQHEPALNVVGTQLTEFTSNAATQSYGITSQQGTERTGLPPHSQSEASFACDTGLTLGFR